MIDRTGEDYYREFVVPTDNEMQIALGVVPEDCDGEPTIRLLRINATPKDEVNFSYDVFGKSIRCRWYRDGTEVLDLYREGATLLRTVEGPGWTGLAVDFETESLAGHVSINVYPEVYVKDSLLLR